ncbi:heme-binding protein [Pelagibacterales bacterium SAG-MED31]|nr:heme-binding protein [Pelagibacterales bacterium SAG-MED31]|tara:strand:+ start:2691 stop:3293 length:603 start_codon:yes stop_codon:yes gene_type:complete
MIKNHIFTLVISLFTLIYTNISMALEEPSFEIIQSNADYEIRQYGDRLAVEVEFTNESSGFRYLFNYISGENTTSEELSMTAPVTQSAKIDMTVPVTQFSKDNKMVMQFYLPSKFSIENAPIPTNKRVNLVTIDGGYYAVLKYSGRVSDKNYIKHLSKLKGYLEKDKIEMIDDGTKAIFDGPFTLPILRRNEAMIKIKWN